MNSPSKTIIKSRISALSPEKREILRERLQAQISVEDSTKKKTAYLSAHIVLDNTPVTQTPEQLANKLKQLLPQYMIPQGFILHDRLPTTINGKIDKGALLAKSELRNNDRFTNKPVNSNNSLEVKLIQIWESIFERESIHAEDDFFELGGDSILAIQLVSECRKNKIEIAVSDLFRHPSISKLLTILEKDIDETSKIDSETAEILAIWRTILQDERLGTESNFFESGGDSISAISLISKLRELGYNISISQLFQAPTVTKLIAQMTPESQPVLKLEPKVRTNNIPFTPIQNWFFEQNFKNANHWNQSLLLEIPGNISEKQVEKAIHELYKRRDALRIKITPVPTGLKQCIEAYRPDHVPFRKVKLATENTDSEIVEISNQEQVSIKLAEGNLLRTVFIHRQPEASNQLLLIAHHLCVDTISWDLIRKDLTAVLTSDKQLSGQIPLFAQWAHSIAKLTETSNEKTSYWQDLNYLQYPTIPFDTGSYNENTEGSAEIHTDKLDKKSTSFLLKKTTTRENSVQTFLISALSLTLKEWLNSSKILLGIEGHGRDISDLIDSSSVVGWLTNYYPIIIDLEYAQSSSQALAETQNQLQKVPDQGTPYGMARYLEDNPELSKIPLPEVTVNYLGKTVTKESNSSGALKILKQRIGADRDPDNLRTVIWEINAIIVNDCLEINWSYSKNLFEKATIENLSRTLIQNLEKSVFSEQNTTHYPLTESQEALLLHRLSNPQNDQGELLLSAEIKGSLSISAFEKAWNQVHKKHASLHASINYDQDDIPALRVVPNEKVSCTYLDLVSSSHDLSEKDLDSVEMRIRDEHLNINEAPAYHVNLIRIDEDVHRFYWHCHHIFLDGWSSAIVLKDLLSLLNDQDEVLTSNDHLFLNYQQWRSKLPVLESAVFWRNYLKNTEPCLICHDSTPSVNSERFTKEIIFPSEVFVNLKSTANRFKITPGTLATAAWAIVLSEFSKAHTVLFASTFSGRNVPIEGVESLVGNLANLAPLKIEIDHEETLSSWLQQILQIQDTVSNHAHFSILKILNWSNQPELFDASFTIANYPWEFPDSTIQLKNFKGDSTSTYPIAASLFFEASLKFSLSIDKNRILEETAQEIIDRFGLALSRLCSPIAKSVNDCLDETYQPTIIAPVQTKKERKRSIVRNKTDNDDLTTEKISQIIQDILEIDTISADDSFFDLGGTSIQAVQLFRAIEDSFDIRLPVSSLFKYQSAAQIASLITNKSDKEPQFKNLVQIREGRGFSPIFLIHAGGMELLFYRDLANKLDPRIPVFGLQPIGLDGSEEPLDEIKEIASRYNKEIQSRFPNAPYFIIGHCIGGTIAVEMANQLKSKNYRVPLVVSIDGPAPKIKKVEQPNATFIKRVLRPFRGKKRIFFSFLKNGYTKTKYNEHILKLRKAYWRASSQSVINKTDIRLVLLNSKVEGSSFQNTEYWKAAAPNAIFHYFNCDHSDVLKEPNVNKVAAKITEELNSRYFDGELRLIEK